jgi:hypothetical protein
MFIWITVLIVFWKFPTSPNFPSLCTLASALTVFLGAAGGFQSWRSRQADEKEVRLKAIESPGWKGTM